MALASARDMKPEMRLDTVTFDMETEQVLLLWRGHLVLREGMHDVRGLRITAEGVSRPRRSER
ncbi:hypothetical protein [Melittangium boletus]|uniref:hypothetical protein n=1 Tax=Melittangium boletus TaxID=83453 RepID=UPI000BB3C2D8|nr:hypothetical protein [Melittangium boletus]